MPLLNEITHSKQLLVEGRDALEFFKAFLKHLEIADFQLQNFGGITELRTFLKALRNVPGFQGKVRALGIIRDAENNPQGAIQSVTGALKATGLPVPGKAETATENTLQTSVLILPNDSKPGMLETLCLEAVKEDPAMQCVQQYFDCLKQQSRIQPVNLTKAQLHAFLASRAKPDLLVGQAASAGYFPWDHSAFTQVKDFLLRLSER